MDSIVEAALRARIMDWIGERAKANGGFVHRDELLGFSIDGESLMLVNPGGRGIWNPRGYASTLAITQSADGPYLDVETEDGLLHYAYERGNPMGGSNLKMRRARETGLPLILFRKETPNIYTPVMPVYVVDDLPAERTFVIALDESFTFMSNIHHMTVDQRKYARRLANVRLHQPVFRTRVMVAYGVRCAVCDLRHGALLDAAHIVPDGEKRGLPVVTNGLALCKIHHAAYDQNMLGITADYVVEIDRDLLEEIDGPMLKHGIQEMDGRVLHVPKRRGDRPDRELLRWRHERFVGRSLT